MRLPFFVAASILANTSFCQTLLLEHFDDVESLFDNGWLRANRSYPLGPETWMQGGPLGADAIDGDSMAFLGNGYLAGWVSDQTWTNISDWIFTPPLQLQNGDAITFYALSASCFSQPDRLEVRMNANADINVGFSSTSVGEYTRLLLPINENQLPLGMPSVSRGDDWAWYSAVITGLSEPVTARVAIRYFVLNGGPAGPNSSFIGIDALRISRGTVGLAQVEQYVITLSPNPSTGLVRLLIDHANPAMQDVLVTGADGRQLGWHRITDNGTLDLSAYDPGSYTLLVRDRITGMFRTGRVVLE